LTIYQAGGHVSKLIVEALLKTRKHTVTITRFDSTTELPTGVVIKKVKYNDQANLVSAIQGQDAIIHTMSGFALPEMQTTLIEAAAAAASVPWFLPNEYGTDPLNLEMRRDTLLDAALNIMRAL
jgi:putative NADH-flavin reductase